MSYPYWGELVWLLVGGVAVVLFPAIFGIMLTAAHNAGRGRAAIVAAGMSHKAEHLADSASVNPLAFLWILAVLYIGYYSFGYIVA